jgi:large subunit ribosomal protein L30
VSALEVTQVRSAIGSKPKHRATLRALGLRGIGRSRVLPDRPEVRGMLARVPHLVTVTEVADERRGAPRRRSVPSARSSEESR